MYYLNSTYYKVMYVYILLKLYFFNEIVFAVSDAIFNLKLFKQYFAVYLILQLFSHIFLILIAFHILTNSFVVLSLKSKVRLKLVKHDKCWSFTDQIT